MNKDIHILIVDDNLKNLQVVSSSLKEKSYKIAVALDGKSGLEIAEKNNIDLILLDIMMPDMSGFEVCKKLKKLEKTKGIPVIFLTAKTDTDDIVKGFKIGGADYIPKPFKKEELHTRVDNQIQLKLAKDRLKEALKMSDSLLLNTLPADVAEDLKKNGKSIPKEFKDVTVFVSDFVHFTDISLKMQPIKIIDELNEMYTVFDNIMEKHKCERIKTIGDAYLAVCGMPNSDTDHATKIINAAIEIRDYIEERSKNAEIKWQIRIGIHTGSVVGGIVGIKKYIYDIFGDTVNTAFRVEAASKPMRINVSDDTCSLLKDKYDFIERPPENIKGKGMMTMHFLKSEKLPLSVLLSASSRSYFCSRSKFGITKSQDLSEIC
ncbi:MAG: response regulator [Candidatus Cloacimonetes bacterium]|nr:response regulator [Candidatus Cloacimonadota bacterium]